MGFLPGCGENKTIDCPLSKAVAGWRKISKFNRMIDNINHPNASKVYNCRRIDTRGILQHVRDKSEGCAFHRGTKLCIEHYLGVVENRNYPFGEGEFFTTPCTL